MSAGGTLGLRNVCFEWKNGHDANVTRCPLMTQSGQSFVSKQHQTLTASDARVRRKAEIVRLEETLDATADKVRKYAPSRLTHAKL